MHLLGHSPALLPLPLLASNGGFAGAAASIEAIAGPVLQLRGGSALPYESAIEGIEALFEVAIAFINFGGGFLLLAGVVIALANTVLFLLNKLFNCGFTTLLPFTTGGRNTPVQLARVKLQLGSMITLALTVLVASDVLDTLIKPVHAYKMETLYKLAIVAGIRTATAYTLNKEMDEVVEQLEKQDGKQICI